MSTGRCKAGRYTSHVAAISEARRAEVRYSEPWGAMQPYQCRRCGYFHIGRRRGYHRFVARARREYLFDLTAEIELGARVVGIGKRENYGPPYHRHRFILSHARGLERRARAAA